MRRLLLIVLTLQSTSLFAISMNQWFFETKGCSLALVRADREEVYYQRAIEKGLTDKGAIAEFVDRSVKRKVLLIAMDDAQYEYTTAQDVMSKEGTLLTASAFDHINQIFAQIGASDVTVDTEAPFLASMLNARPELDSEGQDRIQLILLCNFIAAASRAQFFDSLLHEDLSVPAEDLDEELLSTLYREAFLLSYGKLGLPQLPKVTGSEKPNWKNMVKGVLNSPKLPPHARKTLREQVQFAEAYHVTEQIPEALILNEVAKYFQIEL